MGFCRARRSLLVAQRFPVISLRQIPAEDPEWNRNQSISLLLDRRIRAISLYFPCGTRNWVPETGSPWTPPTAIESALAETLRPLTATLPETPALSRGLSSIFIGDLV